MYNGMIVLGLPKSGTTYLSKFFQKQPRYSVIKDTNDEFHDNIKDVNQFDYKFGKNPDIALYYHADDAMRGWVEHIDSRTKSCLFLIVLRSYSSCLYSLYTHRIKYGFIKETLPYKEFVDIQKKNFLTVEQNCLDIAGTLQNNRLKIIFQSDIQNINTISLMDSLGLRDIEESEFPYDTHQEFVYQNNWTKYTSFRPKNNDFFIDKDLEKAYIKMVSNRNIQAMTHNFD